jgi:hypothetical protein
MGRTAQGEIGTGEEAVALADQLEPGIFATDIRYTRYAYPDG